MLSIICRHLNHHRAGLLASGVCLVVRVKVVSLVDEEAFSVVDRDAEVGKKKEFVVRYGLEGKAVYS